MGVQPLTDLQKLVLTEIFRDRSAAPKTIAVILHIRVADVLRTIWALRRKEYILHHQPPACFGGSGPVYRPLLTINGTPVQELGDADGQLFDYLQKHEIKKLPPGRAHGTYKSQHWDREL